MNQTATPKKNYFIPANKINFDDFIFAMPEASGAYGVVHKHTINQFAIAVKLVKEDLPESVSSSCFKREIRILSKLDNHENIVNFIGYTLQPKMAIITEWCNGKDLYRLIHTERRANKLSRCQILNITLQIANGMVHMHEKKILHHDLKTSNVMLNKTEDDRYEVKIGDFGVSVCKSEEIRLKRPLAKKYWMSPEVCHPMSLRTVYTEKSDVYSFAIIMFELATQSLPFYNQEVEEYAGFREGHELILHKLNNYNAALPYAYINLIIQNTELNPDERMCMSELKQAIKNISIQIDKFSAKLIQYKEESKQKTFDYLRSIDLNHISSISAHSLTKEERDIVNEQELFKFYEITKKEAVCTKGFNSGLLRRPSVIPIKKGPPVNKNTVNIVDLDDTFHLADNQQIKNLLQIFELNKINEEKLRDDVSVGLSSLYGRSVLSTLIQKYRACSFGSARLARIKKNCFKSYMRRKFFDLF